MTSHWNLSSVVGKEFVEIIFPNFHQIFLSTPPVRSGGGRKSNSRGGDIIRALYLLFHNEDDDDDYVMIASVAINGINVKYKNTKYKSR